MGGNHNKICEVCGVDGSVNWLIPCKSCSTRGRHIYCLQNPKVQDPELVFDTDLLCGDCKSRARQQDEEGRGGDVGAQADDSVQGGDHEKKGTDTGNTFRQKKKKKRTAVAAAEQQGCPLIGPTAAVGSKAAATAPDRRGASDAADALMPATGSFPGANQGGRIGNAATTGAAAKTTAGAALLGPVVAAADVVDAPATAPQCPHSVFASRQVQEEVVHEVNGDDDDNDDNDDEMTDVATTVEGEAAGSQQQQHRNIVPGTGVADDGDDDRPLKRSRSAVASSTVQQQVPTMSMAAGSKGRVHTSLTKQFQHQLRGEGRHSKFVDLVPAAPTNYTRKDTSSGVQQPPQHPAPGAGKLLSARPAGITKASSGVKQQQGQHQAAPTAAHQVAKAANAGRQPVAPPQQQRPVPTQLHAGKSAAITMLGGQGSATSTSSNTAPAVGPSTAAVVQSRLAPPLARPAAAVRRSSPGHILGGGAAAAGRGSGQPGAQVGPRNIIQDCFGKNVVLPTKPSAGGSQQVANGGDSGALVSQSAGGNLAGSGASLQQLLPSVGSRPSVCSTPAIEDDPKRTPLWKGKGVLTFELDVPAAVGNLGRAQNMGRPSRMMALALDSIDPYVPHVSMAKLSEILRDQAGSQGVRLSLMHTSEVMEMQEEIYETNEFYKANEPCEACLFMDLSVSIGSAVDTFSSLLDKLDKSGSILAMELPFLSKEKLACDPWLERLLAARTGGNTGGSTYRLYFKRHRLPIIGLEDRGGPSNGQDGLKDALLCLTGSRRHIHLMSLWDKTPAIEKGIKGILMKEAEKQARAAKKVKFYRRMAQGDSDDPDEQGSSRGHNKEVQKRESMQEKAKDILSILQKVVEEEDEEEERAVQQDSQHAAPSHGTSCEHVEACTVTAEGAGGVDPGDGSHVGAIGAGGVRTISSSTDAPQVLTAAMEVAAPAMQPATLLAMDAAVAMETMAVATDRAAPAIEQVAILIQVAAPTSTAALPEAEAAPAVAMMEDVDSPSLQLPAADAAPNGLVHQEAAAGIEMPLQPAANIDSLIGHQPGTISGVHILQNSAAGSHLLPQQPASVAANGPVFQQVSDSHKPLHTASASGDHMLHATTVADSHMLEQPAVISNRVPHPQPAADDSYMLQCPANAGNCKTLGGTAALSYVLVQPTTDGDAAMKDASQITMAVESSGQLGTHHGAVPCDGALGASVKQQMAESTDVGEQQVMALGQQIQQPTFEFELQERLQGLQQQQQEQQQQESLQDFTSPKGSDDMSIDSTVKDEATVPWGMHASTNADVTIACLEYSKWTEAGAATAAAATQQPDKEPCTTCTLHHHHSATEDLPTWRQLLTHSRAMSGGSSAATPEGPQADDLAIAHPSSREVMWTWRDLLDKDHGAAVPISLSCHKQQQVQQEQQPCHQAPEAEASKPPQSSVAEPCALPGFDGNSRFKWSQIRVPVLQAATMDPGQSGQVGLLLRRQLPSLVSDLQALPVMPLHGIKFGLVASDGEALELQATLDEARDVLGFEWTRISMDKAPELLSNIHVLLLSSTAVKKVSELRGVIIKSIAVHPIEVYRAHIIISGLQRLAAQKLYLQQLCPEQAAVHPAAEAVCNPSIAAALGLLKAAGSATADDCQPLYPHRVVVLLDAQGFLDTPPQVLERLAGCLHAGSQNWGGQPCVLQMRAADVVEVQRSGSEEHRAVMSSLLAHDFRYMYGWDSGSSGSGGNGGLRGGGGGNSGGALLRVLDTADESQQATSSVRVLKDAMRMMHRRRPGRFVVAAYSQQQQAEELHSKSGSEDDNYIRCGRKCKDILAGAVTEVVAFLDLLLQDAQPAKMAVC